MTECFGCVGGTCPWGTCPCRSAPVCMKLLTDYIVQYLCMLTENQHIDIMNISWHLSSTATSIYTIVHYIIGTANLHAAMVVVCIVRNENVSWIFKAGKIDNWDPIPQGPLVSSCRFSLSPSRCWSSLSQVRCRLCTHWHPNSHDRWFPRIVKHSIVRPPKKKSVAACQNRLLDH